MNLLVRTVHKARGRLQVNFSPLDPRVKFLDALIMTIRFERLEKELNPWSKKIQDWKKIKYCHSFNLPQSSFNSLHFLIKFFLVSVFDTNEMMTTLEEKKKKKKKKKTNSSHFHYLLMTVHIPIVNKIHVWQMNDKGMSRLLTSKVNQAVIPHFFPII